MNAAELQTLASRYAIPDDLAEFLKDGTLEVLEERLERHTVRFLVPALNVVTRREVVKTYEVVWTHPDHRDDMDYELPGNFYVETVLDDGQRDFVENDGGPDMDELDDLIAWLEEAKGE